MTKKIIVKQNELIDNFIFNATESELQILNYAVSITNPHWENKNLVYRIDIPELVNVYKTKSNNTYKLYRDALNRLMKRETHFYDDVINEKVTQNIIIEYREPMNDNSYIKFKFNEYVSTRISKLKGLFTQYDIKHIANFKSRYAFLLYEYFKMKLQLKTIDNIDFKKEFLIHDFKEKLDILDKYKIFAELERNVLKPAKLNINKHSDIHIEYRVKRKARTPVSIVFKARYKNKADKVKSLTGLDTDSKKPVKEEQQDLQITNEQIEKNKQTAKNYLDIFKKNL